MKKVDKSKTTTLSQMADELIIANKELVYQNEEKEKRAAELVIANEEKEKSASELVIAKAEKAKRAAELVIAKAEKAKRAAELVIANAEKEKRADELIIANKELAYQNEEKLKRAAELVIADIKKTKHEAELVIEKAKWIAKSIIAGKELSYQTAEKANREAELVIANIEKANRSAELVIANVEKANRSAELVIANKELVCQKSENTKRAAELIIANVEKASRAAELVISNIEKARRAAELVITNKELVLSKEKEKLVNALQKSDAKYNTMISNISDVIGIIGADGIMKYKSSNIEKWFGWQPQDLVGTDGFSNVHPDDLERVKAEFFTVLEKEDSSITLELRYKCKDGSYKPIELTAKNLINDPIINGVLLNYRDITERKQAENALRESEKRFRTIFDQSPLAMALFDMEGHTIISNLPLSDMVGYSNDELSKIMVADFTYHEDADKDMNQFIELIEGRISNYRMEKRYVHKNGNIVWGNLYVTVINDENGTSKEIIGMVVDITERKKAEKTLKENEERLRDIIFSIGDWVWEVDQKGIYTYSSQQGTNILGFSSDEIIGKTPFDFMQQDEAAKTGEIFSEIVANKAPIKDLENWNIDKNGEKICLRTNGVPILDNEGNLKGYRGVDKDITDFKKKEAALKQMNEVMKSLYQRLENIREEEQKEISRNIHDNLGQSLTALKFDLGTLINETESGSKENIKLAGMIEMVTQIIRNVQRISSELRPPALDELGLAASMEWYCEDLAERTGLQLHLELDNVQTENLNKNLALYRVLQEALTNVIRHAGAKNIFIKLCILGEDILLLIKDDGIGITPDKINSVKSLGILGMFERIRQYGGKIEISNPDKKGTEVKVRLSIK